MCGRYGSWSAGAAVARYFDADPLPPTEEVEASWNIAPGSDVRVVVERLARDSAGDDDVRAARQLRCARWGLLPGWARRADVAFRAFNARSETAASKPTFRQAFRSFRALVPADCWYEWRRPAVDSVSPDEPERPRSRPYAVSRQDEEPLALAGLCAWWPVPASHPAPRPGPSIHDKDGARWMLTCTILTRPAREELAWLHDREPVVLGTSVVDRWLDPSLREPGEVSHLLEQPGPALRWWEVGPEIGSARSRGPQLALPLRKDGEGLV
ncbi:SOS response-associated peptidase [Actinomyces faecalis]|uniref:SOS response-associated peptidase n=1 Tax=Actinomyces faecalis TaxID=2722820 RepID=UPI0015565ECB|nr:SOS response-associated peptidase [Actinomyces faecalis]